VEDELREGPVEHGVVERERLRRTDTDVRPGDVLAALLDERLRRIHACDLLAADQVGEHARQRAGAATHVGHLLPALHPRLACELRCQRPAVPPHEVLVGVGLLEHLAVRGHRAC
jgi:hypothetical protein